MLYIMFLVACQTIDLYEQETCDLQTYPEGSRLVILREYDEPYDYCYVALEQDSKYFYIGDINCPEQPALYDISEIKIYE